MAAEGRWSTVTSPAGPDRPQTEPSSLERFVENIEISFNAIGQSLTDPGTAATFLTTLDVWERVLQGSHAHGHIGDEELAKLAATLRGMREVPRLV